MILHTPKRRNGENPKVKLMYESKRKRKKVQKPRIFHIWTTKKSDVREVDMLIDSITERVLLGLTCL